jgi:uncharacterized protein YecE (DUF72 family)
MSLPQTGPLHCGPSGWAHPQWQGLFYPAARSRDFHQLEYAARFFSSIELTSSFFAPLRPELSRLWCYQVRENPEFQFTARAWRRLTYEAAWNAADVAAFRQGIAPLAEAGKLGAVLLQMPSGFRYTRENQEHFLRLRRALSGLPLVAEFRHASWMAEEALALLIDHHVGFCNLDQPDHSRAMPPTAFRTSATAYVRLCGRSFAGPYQYTEEELADWTQRIAKVSRYAKQTFVVFSNATTAHGLVNAFQMKRLLGLGPRRAPRELVRRFGKELSQLQPDKPLQPTLFDTVAA